MAFKDTGPDQLAERLEYGATPWKTAQQLLKRLNVEFLQDPIIPHLGGAPEELKTGPKTDTGTPMFIVMLFTVAKM